MIEAFVCFAINNGSGETLGKVTLDGGTVSIQYASNAEFNRVIGAGADWVAVIAYNDLWEPYVGMYDTADLQYSDTELYPAAPYATCRTLVSASEWALFKSTVEAHLPPLQPGETYSHEYAIAPNADTLYILTTGGGVTYLLSAQVDSTGLDMSSLRTLATAVIPGFRFPSLRFDGGGVYTFGHANDSKYYQVTQGQFVELDSSSSFSLARAPRYPDFGGAIYDFTQDDVLQTSYPMLVHPDGTVLYGTNVLGSPWLLANGRLEQVPTPAIALTPQATYVVGGGQIATPTGFWVDLVRTTQTTDAVIEFTPLQSITIDDVAELTLTLECDGGSGATESDIGQMQFSLQALGLDSTNGGDVAEMGFYLRAQIGEQHAVRDTAYMRLRVRMEAQCDPITAITPPQLPDLGVGYLRVQTGPFADGYHTADAVNAQNALSMFAFDSTPGVAPDFGDMRIDLLMRDVNDEPWPRGARIRMVTGPVYMHGWGGMPYEMTRENLLFRDKPDTGQSIDIRSRLMLDDNAPGRVRTSVTTRSKLLIDDRIDSVYAELTHARLTLREEALGELMLSIHDRLLLSGRASSAAEARAVVSSALALLAVADITPAENPADRVALSTAAREAVLLGGETFDRLVLRDLVPYSMVLAAAVRDTVRLDDDAALRAEVHQRLADGLGLVAHLHLDDGHYAAWAMNTDSRASVRYRNYGFNSFMRVGGREYAANDAGLYRLGGDTDDGAPIQSHIRLGMSALGNRLVKHIPDVYLGYSASGDLLLKAVISDSATGKREANVYRLVARGATSAREGRVKLGRGLNAVYWDFIIENVDGADFEIDLIEFMPLVINRRTRGNAGAR